MPESLFSGGAEFSAVGKELIVDLRGYAGAGVQLSGTWAATVTFSASTLRDGTYATIYATPSNSATPATTATANGLYFVSTAGVPWLKVACTAYTSGTIVINVAADISGGGAGAGGGSGGGGAVTIADGADVTEGAIADSKVTGDNSGTVSAKLRGLNYFLGLVTDTVNNWLKVSIQNTSLAVAGDVANDAADSGNPVKIGGKAASAAPTAVAAADRVNGLFDLWGRLHGRNGAQAPVASTFTQSHIPATNTQATATQSSAGSGKRNVCTGFTVTLASGASAPTPGAPVSVSVIDGASGATTYLWRSIITIPAVAGAQVSIVRTGIWLVGSQATAMTLEFSAAGGSNTYESVTLNGVVVEE